MEVTIQEAIDFINTASEYLNFKDRKPSNLTYALGRTMKRIKPLLEAWQERVDDEREKLQKKDKDGVFEFYDAQNQMPKFTAENHSAFRKKFNEMKREKITFEPYLATIVPQDLEAMWYNAFIQFVFEEPA